MSVCLVSPPCNHPVRAGLPAQLLSVTRRGGCSSCSSRRSASATVYGPYLDQKSHLSAVSYEQTNCVVGSPEPRPFPASLTHLLNNIGKDGIASPTRTNGHVTVASRPSCPDHFPAPGNLRLTISLDTARRSMPSSKDHRWSSGSDRLGSGRVGVGVGLLAGVAGGRLLARTSG